MNYFKIKSFALAGMEAFPVEVESMQSRRLPFLQIIGCSNGEAAELRERVLSAIEACGYRPLSRRVTVRLSPSLRSISLENLDLAVALSVLAVSNQIPMQRLQRSLLISGALCLDGTLRSLSDASMVHHLMSRMGCESAIVPLDESGLFDSHHLMNGGGFRSLNEVVAFLKGEVAKGEKQTVILASKMPTLEAFPPLLQQFPLVQRISEIVAAGAHSLAIAGMSHDLLRSVGGCLLELLPSLHTKEQVELSAVARYFNAQNSVDRPLIEHCSSDVRKNFRLNPSKVVVESWLRAQHGLLLVNDLLRLEGRSLSILLEIIQLGAPRAHLGLAERFSRAVPMILAGLPLCSCASGSEGSEACDCRSSERIQFQQKARKTVSRAFDLYLHHHSLFDSGSSSQTSFGEARKRVGEARAKMLSRQGKLNSQLTHEELIRVVAFSSQVSAFVRTCRSRGKVDGPGLQRLLRTALTISDLRGGSSIEPKDLFEAQHYCISREFASGASGKRLARLGSADRNSRAMP